MTQDTTAPKIIAVDVDGCVYPGPSKDGETEYVRADIVDLMREALKGFRDELNGRDVNTPIIDAIIIASEGLSPPPPTAEAADD